MSRRNGTTQRRTKGQRQRQRRLGSQPARYVVAKPDDESRQPQPRSWSSGASATTPAVVAPRATEANTGTNQANVGRGEGGGRSTSGGLVPLHPLIAGVDPQRFGSRFSGGQ
jgi:hypothetical protein